MDDEQVKHETLPTNKEMQRYLRQIHDLETEMFSNRFFKQGVIRLDDQEKKIVIGLKQLGEQEKRFKERVNEIVPSKAIEWTTVKYSRHQLAHKLSVVNDDVRSMIKDPFNNFMVRSTEDRTQLLLRIDTMPDDVREKLKGKFSDMLKIEVDGDRKNLNIKADKQEIPSTVKGLTMEAKKDSYPLHVESFNINIQNNHDQNNYRFGKSYSLEKYENGTWYKIPFDSMSFNSIGLSIGSGGSHSQEIYLTSLDYIPEPGHYRVIKSFDDKNKNEFFLAAEFRLSGKK